MKSFSDFKTIRKEVKDQNVRDQYYREEIYKVGEWVLTEKDNVGKIIRRGPNYVICLTAEETKFRTWVKDIKEVFEIGTDAYRQYVMSLTPGQKVQKPKGTEKVDQVIPTDPKKDKMDNHESLVQAAVKALNEYSPVPPVKKTPVGTEGTANKNPKGTGGAKGIGGGDAPGMKMAEPKGTKGKPSIKKPKHACATKVEHPEWGAGNCIKEMHTLDEEGTVTHYDVMFEHGLEQNVPVQTLNITLSEYHEHAINDDKNKEVLDEGGLDAVNKKAVKKKFANRKDKDIDNDGDVDGSDKFLHKRRKAISKKMAKEHHQKDNDGNVIEHVPLDDSPEADAKRNVTAGVTKGLDKPPHLRTYEDATPSSVEEASLATARKNIGRDPKKPSCWKGYKAKGTKMKGGKSVPNCVKEFAEWRKEVTEKK